MRMSTEASIRTPLLTLSFDLDVILPFLPFSKDYSLTSSAYQGPPCLGGSSHHIACDFQNSIYPLQLRAKSSVFIFGTHVSCDTRFFMFIAQFKARKDR